MSRTREEPSAELLVTRLREEVTRHPFVALLAGVGIGAVLASGAARRALPSLVDLGVRLLVASAIQKT